MNHSVKKQTNSHCILKFYGLLKHVGTLNVWVHNSVGAQIVGKQKMVTQKLWVTKKL